MKWIKGMIINFQFFTSIPVPVEVPMDKANLEKAMRTFPLIGLFQGIFYAVILYGFLNWTMFSPLTAAFALWLSIILLTGGIHLDGWMDTSDAFFSYQEPNRRLEIMKDPRTGAFGVISVLVLLATRFFFIYEITTMLQPVGYLLIILIPFFGKLMMGLLLFSVKAAKDSGLGVLFQNAATKRTLYVYPIYLLFILICAGLVNLQVFLWIILFTLVSFLLFFYLRKKVLNWFGGMTGDVLGASVEGMELLLWMTLWGLHYTVMG